MNKALFLDRDGVINKEKNYLYKIKDFEFIDGVFDTCRYFHNLGYLIIIITNQAGIARKKYTEEEFHILNTWMLEEFKKQDVEISKVYFCPHHPDFTNICECRKPKTGMIIEAKNEFMIDLEKSILVGDKESDIIAGIKSGITKNYLIDTGHKITSNSYKVKVLDNLRKLKEEYLCDI